MIGDGQDIEPRPLVMGRVCVGAQLPVACGGVRVQGGLQPDAFRLERVLARLHATRAPLAVPGRLMLCCAPSCVAPSAWYCLPRSGSGPRSPAPYAPSATPGEVGGHSPPPTPH